MFTEFGSGTPLATLITDLGGGIWQIQGTDAAYGPPSRTITVNAELTLGYPGPTIQEDFQFDIELKSMCELSTIGYVSPIPTMRFLTGNGSG